MFKKILRYSREVERSVILCTTVGIEPSLLCYEMCVLAYRCGALKAWEREKVRKAVMQNEHA